jgi:hypothetical protein
MDDLFNTPMTVEEKLRSSRQNALYQAQALHKTNGGVKDAEEIIEDTNRIMKFLETGE